MATQEEFAWRRKLQQEMLAKLLMQPNTYKAGDPPANAWAPVAAAFQLKRAGKKLDREEKEAQDKFKGLLANILEGKEVSAPGPDVEGPLPVTGMGPGVPQAGPAVTSRVPYSDREKMRLALESPDLQGFVAKGLFPERDKPTDFQRDLRAGGIDPSSPQGRKLLQARYDKSGLYGDAVGGGGASDPNAPWRDIRDVKKADEARTRFGVAADARVAKEQEDVQNSRIMVNDLDRFMHLNETTSTGGGYKVPGSQFIGTALSGDVAEMKSITDKMTPMMRQGMPGAASDRDVAMFRGATVGLEKPKEANKNIATGLKAAAQNRVDRANFLADYVTDRGHDRGADTAWKKYLDANPIFDQDAERGSYQLNPNRMGYQDWTSSGGKPNRRGKGPTATSQPSGKSITDRRSTDAPSSAIDDLLNKY